MSEPTSVEKLTSWAAGSDEPGRSVRAHDAGAAAAHSHYPACSDHFLDRVHLRTVQRLALAAADRRGLELRGSTLALAEPERGRDRADLRRVRSAPAAMAAREDLRRPDHAQLATARVYKLNGIAAWFITHVLFLGCTFGLHLFKAGIVWDHFGEILATLVLFAMLFCLFLYFKGRYWPTSEDRSLSGNFIWDYYWGVELHPTLLGVNLKQLTNCRFSMMGWSVIVCSFAARQAELDPGGHRQQLHAGMRRP